MKVYNINFGNIRVFLELSTHLSSIDSDQTGYYCSVERENVLRARNLLSDLFQISQSQPVHSCIQVVEILSCYKYCDFLFSIILALPSLVTLGMIMDSIELVRTTIDGSCEIGRTKRPGRGT